MANQLSNPCIASPAPTQLVLEVEIAENRPKSDFEHTRGFFSQRIPAPQMKSVQFTLRNALIVIALVGVASARTFR